MNLTSCIDDYYKLDYVTQYSFYLALIVLINKKDNKTGLYLFTEKDEELKNINEIIKHINGRII